jgi:hypothetical protein
MKNNKSNFTNAILAIEEMIQALSDLRGDNNCSPTPMPSSRKLLRGVATMAKRGARGDGLGDSEYVEAAPGFVRGE